MPLFYMDELLFNALILMPVYLISISFKKDPGNAGCQDLSSGIIDSVLPKYSGPSVESKFIVHFKTFSFVIYYFCRHYLQRQPLFFDSSLMSKLIISEATFLYKHDNTCRVNHRCYL